MKTMRRHRVEKSRPPVEAVDAETLEMLAEAIAKPGSDALLIDKDNCPHGRMSIRGAARSGASFAIELADDMVGLDVDRREAVRWMRNSLMERLESLKIPMVVQNSGTPGHLHVFARVPEARLKREIEIAARFAGCNVWAGQRIRPPLSPHRLGLNVSMITPARVLEAVRALTPADEQKELARKKRRGASGRMFSLLRDGDCDGRYQSRSEVVQALATMAVNQGYSQEWLLKVLLNPSNRAGEKIQRMGETEARRYVAQSYHKARAFVGNHPAFGDRGEAAAAIVEKIDRAADIILRSARPGQAGATDYSVLAVHLAIARRVGSLTYGASDREVAELAGLSRPTVTRSHRRLIENCKFLKRIKRPAIGATTASQWRFRLPAGSVARATNPTLIGGVRPTGKADHTPGADLWRRGKGLGKSNYRLWSLLTSPKTAAELATTLGIKVRSVWDHLWMLEDGVFACVNSTASGIDPMSTLMQSRTGSESRAKVRTSVRPMPTSAKSMRSACGAAQSTSCVRRATSAGPQSVDALEVLAGPVCRRFWPALRREK
jgi:hypothetical protein